MSSTKTTTTTTVAAADQGGSTPISIVHPDIIQTHILTRLDGPTLASVGCTSSQLHALSTEEKLWKDICNSTWPSTNHPRIRDTISTFRAGHRSFFSDVFPTLDHRRLHRPSRPNHFRPPPAPELISAVDIHYQNKLIYSGVQVIETVTAWFQCSPFRVDLLDPKESVPSPAETKGGEHAILSHVEQYMTLSWILIDPTQKRAANFSSLRPVSVHRHWLTGEVQLRFATIIAGYDRRGSSEFLQCAAVVTCGGKEGGKLHVREVSMQVQNMEGEIVSGKESLVILQAAMEAGRRKRGKSGEERERYEQYLEMKRERRERKQRRERKLDLMCITTAVIIFAAFWAYILIR